MTAGQSRVLDAGSAPLGAAPPVLDAARVAAFAAAARHSGRVKTMKFALPALAVGIVASFIGYSFLSIPGSVMTPIGETAFSGGKLVMANPRLEGFTANGPYSMSAVRAVQDPATVEIIELEGIEARVPLDPRNWATVDAAAGVFDRANNTLSIDHPVKLTTTDGKSAALESALVNVEAGSLVTDKPIDLRMDGVSISAESMQILQSGQVVVFDRKVRMHIEPGKMKMAEAGAGGSNAKN